MSISKQYIENTIASYESPAEEILRSPYIAKSIEKIVDKTEKNSTSIRWLKGEIVDDRQPKLFPDLTLGTPGDYRSDQIGGIV